MNLWCDKYNEEDLLEDHLPNYDTCIVNLYEDIRCLREEIERLIKEAKKLEFKNACIIDENIELASYVTKLKIDRFKKFAEDECWIFDETGENYLESLVCPVVIKADVLKNIIDKLAKYEEERNGNKE